MDPSLNQNCNQQVIYAKFSLKVHYSLPSESDVWHYKQADTDLIRRSIEMFDWVRAFTNSDVNDMIDIFTKAIQNILSNFIRYKTIIIDDNNPPWFNTKIKFLLQDKK